DGKALYVTSRVDSRISVLDPETLEVTAGWDIPGGPDCIAFDPDGKLWVTLRWIARVAMVDPATGEAVTMPVGRSPHGIFVQPRREAMPPSPTAAVPAAGSAVARGPAIQPEDMAEEAATARPAARAPMALVPAAPPVQVVRAEPPLQAAVDRPVADHPPVEAAPWWRRWMNR
ncbi:MAG: cytochrome, partial [Belnapia sp.]|nr:cytochrome [Belnapia sp.]